MTVQTVYVADDGKKFDTETACQTYESTTQEQKLQYEIAMEEETSRKAGASVNTYKANKGGKFAQIENQIQYWKETVVKDDRGLKGTKRLQALINDYSQLLRCIQQKEAMMETYKGLMIKRNISNRRIKIARERLAKLKEDKNDRK